MEEDDPEKYKQAVKVLTMKLFADLERKRRTLEQKMSDDAARKREAELAAEEKRNLEKEFNKNWEESRQGRVNSWLSFQKGKTYVGDDGGQAAAAAAAAAAEAASASTAQEGGGKEKKKKKRRKSSPPWVSGRPSTSRSQDD